MVRGPRGESKEGIQSRGGGISLRPGKDSIFTEIGGKEERMGWIDKFVGGRGGN